MNESFARLGPSCTRQIRLTSLVISRFSSIYLGDNKVSSINENDTPQNNM